MSEPIAQGHYPRPTTRARRRGEAALCLALAHGCRLGAEMSRRAAHLAAITPKLRAKGPPDAIRLLLDDDAVPGTLVTKTSRALDRGVCSTGWEVLARCAS